ncbi:acyl-CoA dehydratase activase [Herbivorax sp. ANBcel31]|uniref:acyl-CoA dehydratase activase n=1 Tax=Herbivorax sp. ANBcel31 TaxID=3069754 RepID=UPI0027B86A18|nr:acyl-CoA dehydratase activase [Herbivorax sp. ANBcel31]MDQ2086079.1 acyl-CoA dehydratase activase [Herbivorax sp. ANBcel31]
MRIIGIDLGSRSVKIVVFEGNNIAENKIFSTSFFYKNCCFVKGGKVAIDFDSLNLGEFDKIISTGYGRNNVNVENAEVILELKAHAYGAMWQTKLHDFTLVDIGGQDSKVMSIKGGKMVDMMLNDKCAASCGRYLENMAVVMEISVEELVEYFKDPVQLNSTCAVFGESELIGKISEGYSIEQLGAGVNYSLFKRIRPLIERFPEDSIVITGGVAKNKAFVKYIKTELDFKRVVVPSFPQLNGAIGCCYYYLKK